MALIELYFFIQKNLNVSRDLYLLNLFFYSPFNHISNVIDPYIDGTAIQDTMYITNSIQAITQNTIFNRLGAFVLASMYIHKIKFTKCKTDVPQVNDKSFIITNHKTANTKQRIKNTQVVILSHFGVFTQKEYNAVIR